MEKNAEFEKYMDAVMEVPAIKEMTNELNFLLANTRQSRETFMDRYADHINSELSKTPEGRIALVQGEKKKNEFLRTVGVL